MFDSWQSAAEAVTAFGLGVYYLAVGRRDASAKQMALGGALILLAIFLA